MQEIMRLIKHFRIQFCLVLTHLTIEKSLLNQLKFCISYSKMQENLRLSKLFRIQILHTEYCFFTSTDISYTFICM